MPLRYRALKGTQGVFHLRYYPVIQCFHPVIDWQKDGYNLTCWGEGSSIMRELGQMVGDGQGVRNGQPGGSFLIDEYERVLLPSTDSLPIQIGYFECFDLIFKNPLNQSEIELVDDYDLDPGDLWDKPYIGLVYVFGADHIIRFETAGQIEYPPGQDQNLITILRKLRPNGGRILVNPAGIVLTKMQRGFEWVPT